MNKLFMSDKPHKQVPIWVETKRWTRVIQVMEPIDGLQVGQVVRQNGDGKCFVHPYNPDAANNQEIPEDTFNKVRNAFYKKAVGDNPIYKDFFK
jgi:hypothetical protein